MEQEEEVKSPIFGQKIVKKKKIKEAIQSNK